MRSEKNKIPNKKNKKQNRSKLLNVKKKKAEKIFFFFFFIIIIFAKNQRSQIKFKKQKWHGIDLRQKATSFATSDITILILFFIFFSRFLKVKRLTCPEAGDSKEPVGLMKSKKIYT